MTNLGRGKGLLGASLLAAAALSFAACAKKGEEAGKPAALPPMEGTPGAVPATPPSAPSAAPPAPGAAAAAPEAKPADPNAAISGEIVLAPSQKANVKPTDTLFLVARRISDNPSARGSLVAVKKLSAKSFPIPFTLSAADMPFQGGAFDGEMTLSIRDDKDGDPMSRRKGDVFGTLPKVKVGTRGVKLALDQLQKEDESLAQPLADSPLRGHDEEPAAPGAPAGHPPLRGHPPAGGGAPAHP